jgi:hypothetical protein
MRALLALAFLSLALISCSPKTYMFIDNENRYGDLVNGLPEKDSTVSTYYKSKILKDVGRYAVANDGYLSNLKTGHWKEYYENGQLKSEGSYKVGSYLNCCMAGPCRNYYTYRYGLWKYYDESGTLEYEAEFIPSELHINTNCEGGDYVVFGLVKNIPLRYIASLTPDKVFELQKVAIDEEYVLITYTPLNGELYVTYDPKR